MTASRPREKRSSTPFATARLRSPSSWVDSPASLVDSTAVINHYLPLAVLIVVGATFLILLFLFRSLFIPLKALVLSVISLSATFGVMVWIFQEGHLSGLLDFTPTGTLIDTMPILMFCVAFGLSMDYEVFLVSRMKELHDNGADNDAAIVGGMQQTGRIITAAALLMSIIFLSLLSSSISFIKLFAVGLALAVLMDAFVIRGILVPAIMKLAGDANWWAPSFMRKVAPRPPAQSIGTSPELNLAGIDRGRIGCADPARLSSHSGKGGFPNEALWSVRRHGEPAVQAVVAALLAQVWVTPKSPLRPVPKAPTRRATTNATNATRKAYWTVDTPRSECVRRSNVP